MLRFLQIEGKILHQQEHYSSLHGGGLERHQQYRRGMPTHDAISGVSVCGVLPGSSRLLIDMVAKHTRN